MAGPFVVDASVFVNAFNPAEHGSEISKEVLARLQAQAVPIIAPTLLLVEVAVAISRGQNNPELARQFASALGRLPHLVLVPLDQMLAQQALNIAAQYRLRGSDAVYAAVAQRFVCSLVTLDQEQHYHIRVIFKTFSPTELLETL